MGVNLYLKKSKDVILYGHGFDSYCHDIQKYFYKFDLGIPERNYSAMDRIGSGSIINGGEKYGKRTITFIGNANSGISDNRITFLRNWITTSDKIYLYLSDSNGLKRIEVFPILSAFGKYSNKIILSSDDFTLKLLTEKPFFENTESTKINFSKNSNPFEIAIINNGIPTPFAFLINFLGTTSKIQIRLYENYGISIIKNFVNGNELEINTSNLEIQINQTVRTNLDYSGTPFMLQTGNNTLTIKSSANGAGYVEFYERSL